MIEVRLDCLDSGELETNTAAITELLKNSPCETILTLRPSEQGGTRELDDETRLAFWSDAIFSNSFFDVELDLAERFMSLEAPQSLPVDWSRTICSHHDFDGGHSNLDHIYERLSATPARILKVATKANDVTDCVSLFHLLERARADGRDLIAIAMGFPGIATRILGPSRGAFLTYAALDDETATAPGQLTASDLNEVYRVNQIDRQTEIFGLIGLPVAHSLSPYLHNAAFASAGRNAVYLPFELNDAKTFLRRMVHPETKEVNWNLRGLSVTAPHKVAVMDQLDWIDAAAREIGAVNNIVVEGNSLHGHNSDAQGFVTPLVEKLGDLTGARCAVIGSGGGAGAALWALQNARAKLCVMTRNAEKGRALAEKFGADWRDLTGASFAEFDVVVNATPLGTAQHLEDQTPALASQLRGARLAYDLVYNPTDTRFLREARKAGCETLGGLAMLVAQAEEQFRLWTGITAPTGVMYEAARKALARR